ncbi:MAG: metallophosphoesterase [Chlorobi bacterium]|nr:metallophosphoesterase [Chlorobiota bacterium]
MNNNRKTVLGALFVLLVILIWQLPLPIETGKDFPVVDNKGISPDGEMIFISDTQEPIWVETFVLSENHNLLARKLIFDEILKEKPAKVFHLGDITALGYYDGEWEPIDNFLRKIIDEKIGFFPTLGNHELMIFPETGKANFMKRFSFYSETGYCVKNGKTAVVMLNSNFDNLTKEEIEKQNKWYENKLNALEKDSTVSAVIVGVHHSPFTNSKIVSPNEGVQKYFVPPFIASEKCKIFLGGHGHAFERFKFKGKDFLVIGGGGGLQQPLYTGDEEKFKDLYSQTKPLRMFHFLKYNLENDTMKFTVEMLDSTFANFHEEYRLDVPLK